MFAHPVEDDLVSIDFSHLDERIYSSVFYLSGQELQFHFAMVESVSKDFNSQTRYSKHESREHSQCELVLNLRVSGLGFALNDILGGSVVELNVITSLKTVRRQWNGLINLHTSVLVRDILCPRGGVYFCCQRTAYEQPKHSSKVRTFKFSLVQCCHLHITSSPYPIYKLVFENLGSIIRT